MKEKMGRNPFQAGRKPGKPEPMARGPVGPQQGSAGGKRARRPGFKGLCVRRTNAATVPG